MKQTPITRSRKPIRPVSPKRAKHRRSAEGQAGLDYMRRVKGLHCCVCGAPPPNEAHHCRDMPEFGEQGLYDQMPAAGRKSGDRDTIPLCPEHHREGPNAYHRSPAKFREWWGPDFGYIGETRAALTDDDISF